MTLQEIFDQLSGGELIKLNIGGDEAGEIQPANYQKVINHINLALENLHQRFNLREGRAVLTLEEGKTVYDISGKATDSLIVDELGTEFNKDVLKLEEVLQEDGLPYSLNERNNPFSMYTLKPSVLHLPQQWKDGVVPTSLTLVYRANHPPLVLPAGETPDNVWVDLPRSHLWALLLFVASRVHTPVGMTNEFHAGNSYYAKYEAECQGLEANGLQIDLGHQNTRLRDNGWV